MERKVLLEKLRDLLLALNHGVNVRAFKDDGWTTKTLKTLGLDTRFLTYYENAIRCKVYDPGHNGWISMNNSLDSIANKIENFKKELLEI